MLDEIIDYVKFLQLQVKVLSMSRLGGAGVVAQVMNDLPSEGPSNLLAATLGQSNVNSGPSPEGLSLTEHQVARLMEDDMGTAMQYLQSKGLCLMPISLASAISSTGAKSKAINEGASGVISDDKTQAVTVSMSSSLAVVGRAPSCTGGVSDDWKISDSGSGTKAGNEGIRQVKGSTELNHEEMSNAFGDAKASESPINGAQNSS
ncbi:hypothetical protein O6H91_Y359300 [Diphasiastrum complanatum]|nr:hypothetical protein O6H91_Y359300 [Diphasiastrum complanatum]